MTVIAASVVLAGCGGSDESEVFTIAGTIAIDESSVTTSQTKCEGRRGFGDIQEGAAVTVKNQDGTTVGTGRLGEGERASSTSRVCSFPFTVESVPAGNKFYEVEVSRRGGLTYSEEEARQPLTLTLG